MRDKLVKETTQGGPCASPDTSERENMNNEPNNTAPEVTGGTPAYDLTAPEVAEDPKDVLRREDTQTLRRGMAEFDRKRREAVEELADMLRSNLDYIGPICLVAIPRPGEVLVSKDLKTGRLKSADSAIMVRIASPDEAVVLHAKMEEIIKGDRRDRAGLPGSSLADLLRSMRSDTEEED